MASMLMLADAWEGNNAGASCLDDCVPLKLPPKARWSEMEPDEEEFNGHHHRYWTKQYNRLYHPKELANSNGDELCDTCSGDTDDIVSVCSWTTDQGDWERPHGLESISCAFSATPVMDDQLPLSHSSSSGSGSGSEGAQDPPQASRCAQAAFEVSATSNPANSQLQFGYNSYVPFWVPVAALSPAWNYSVVPEKEGAQQVGQDAQRCPGLQVPAKAPVQKQRGGKARNKIPLGLVKASTSSTSTVSRCQGEVSKRAVTKMDRSAKTQDDSAEAPSTIILRNFPLECTRDALLDVLDAEGFSGAYNFVHMPVDFQTKISLGYALVNMVTHSAALCLWQHFQGFEKWPMGNKQPCEVAWNSPNQGLAAQIERYRNSPLMHHSVPETYRPVLLRNGVRVDFPPPTAKIRPPRIRHQKQPVSDC